VKYVELKYPQDMKMSYRIFNSSSDFSSRVFPHPHIKIMLEKFNGNKLRKENENLHYKIVK